MTTAQFLRHHKGGDYKKHEVLFKTKMYGNITRKMAKEVLTHDNWRTIPYAEYVLRRIKSLPYENRF